MSDVTRILSAIDAGDPQAASELLPLVYGELRKLAAAKLAHEKPGQTLDATGLVHEAYLRLVGARSVCVSFANRRHFFAAAAEAMRRILVENARRKARHKHGGAWQRVPIDLPVLPTTMPDEELLALDAALAKLEAEDPDKARLVHLRFFLGMSNEEAADVLGVSPVTTKRYWRFARAWLRRELRGEEK